MIWLETDPRRASTSGDGLPDGWKRQYGLDPFDDGVIGDYNLHTGKKHHQHQQRPPRRPGRRRRGQSPRISQRHRPHSCPTPPRRRPPAPSPSAREPRARRSRTAPSRTTRRSPTGPPTTSSRSRTTTARGRTTAARTFTMPTTATTRRATSWPSTRTTAARRRRAATATSISAWISTTCKPTPNRVILDIYVAINVGNPGTGERLLPDDIDTLTNMGWQAVVACYQTGVGTVYVDTNPDQQHHRLRADAEQLRRRLARPGHGERLQEIVLQFGPRLRWSFPSADRHSSTPVGTA